MPTDRQAALLELLAEKGACSYQELGAALGVSTMTVRRDVDTLSDAGRLIKTLGGAQIANGPPSLYETDLRSRENVHRSEKRAIARAALDLIEPGNTLFLDGSTTCLEFARALARLRAPITVVSNSVLIALELERATQVTVIVTGGELDRRSATCVGPTTENWVDNLYVDQAFMSTKGFVPNEGTFESSLENLRVKQHVARNSKRVVLLVDHSKFGERALCKVLDAAQLGAVVTDSDTHPAHLDYLEKAGIETHIAETFLAQQSGDGHAA